MIHKKQFPIALLLAFILALLMATSAFAHVCTNANKPTGAGSIGTYNIVTESFEPSNHPKNGGFVTLTDGESFTVDVFLHDVLPDGALAAGPGGDDLCDGVGVDLFLACIGFTLEG